MVQKPKEEMNLIQDGGFPNPTKKKSIGVGVRSLHSNMLVGTFVRGKTIPSEEPEGGINLVSLVQEEGIEDGMLNIQRDVKRDRREVPLTMLPDYRELEREISIQDGALNMLPREEGCWGPTY